VSYAAPAMAVTAEEILELVRQLPPRERLKVVERVVHEVVEADTKAALLTEKPPIYQDLSDEEFEDFLETIQRNRREQPLRTPR
jgi:hypothetical protein